MTNALSFLHQYLANAPLDIRNYYNSLCPALKSADQENESSTSEKEQSHA